MVVSFLSFTKNVFYKAIFSCVYKAIFLCVYKAIFLCVYKAIFLSCVVKGKAFTTQSRLFIPTNLKKRPFENIVGKLENGGNQQFFLFPPMFLLLFPKLVSVFHSNLFFRLQVLSIWTSLKIVCW